MRQFEEQVVVQPNKGRVMFRIRMQYFTLIETGEKKEEIRRASPYWMAFLSREPKPTEAIFVCGPRTHKREILNIEYVKEGGAHVLGRPLSEQGRQDIGDGPVIVFRLGAPIIHGREK